MSALTEHFDAVAEYARDTRLRLAILRDDLLTDEEEAARLSVNPPTQDIEVSSGG